MKVVRQRRANTTQERSGGFSSRPIYAPYTGWQATNIAAGGAGPRLAA
jgi:hypothetical protein